MSTITALCAEHGAVVPMDDGRCGWCGLPTRARQRRGGKPKGKYRKLTDRQVVAAHTLYIEKRLSLRDLGRLLWERFGYASPNACAVSLGQAFIDLGLPRRDRVEACVEKSLKHGLARRGKRGPEYNELRRQRREHRPPCAGVRTQYPRKGQPCELPAMHGSRFCIGHDPERAAWRAASLAAARELLQLDRDLDRMAA